MKTMVGILLSLSAVAYSEPAFVGLLTTREAGALYAIVPSVGSSSRWVKVGDAIEGYVIVEYRPRAEVLVVKKDGQFISLKLKDAKILDGRDGAAEAAVIDVARKLVAKMDHWESDVVYQAAKAEDGIWWVFATKIVEGKKQVRRVRLTSKGAATNYSKLSVVEPR